MFIFLTSRLKLTPFTLEDADRLHQLFTHPFVRRYLWDDRVVSLLECQEMLSWNEQYFAQQGWGLWKVFCDEVLIGCTGLWLFGEETPQLLFVLLPEYTGHGYATEAARAVADYAGHRLGFTDLLAACDVDNLASRQVCRRLGMMELPQVLHGRLIYYRLLLPTLKDWA